MKIRCLPPYSLLSFFVPLVIYFLTVGTHVSFFDSGEFITSSYTLGVAHPPGYPVYIMLSHIFKYIPLGNAAFKVNAFSALFGALCSFITYKIAAEVFRDLESKEILSLTAALSFAFSYTLWSQAVVAEVYCLSTFFIGACIFCVIRYVNGAGRQYLYSATFILGIAICVHYTALVVLPIILPAVYHKGKSLLVNLRVVFLNIFFLFLGLSALLYLPFRAWQINSLVWGDPGNLSQFLWVILRQGYDIEGPVRSVGLFFEQMKSFNLYREFGIVVLFFIIFGFLAVFRRFMVFSIIAMIVLVVLNVGVVIYGNPVMENIFLLESFHGPGYMVLSVFAAGAVFEIGRIAERLKITKKITYYTCLLLLPLSLLIYNYRGNDWSNYYIGYDYGKNVLKSCERDSVLFTWGDSGAFPLWYLQTVENYRTDVVLLHCPHLDAYWYWRDKLNLVEKSRLFYMWENNQGPENMVRFLVRDLGSRRKVHFDYSTKYSVLLPGIVFKPVGMVYTYSEVSGAPTPDNLDYFVMRGFKDVDVLKDLDTEKAISIYAYCFFDLGVYQVMNNDPAGKVLIKRAVEILPSLRYQAVSILGKEQI